MQHKNKFLVLAFLIGLTSLMYEVYAVKVVFLYFIENIYAVSITLSSFLAGLAFSSYYVSRQKTLGEATSIRLFLSMQIGMIIYAILVLQNHHWIPLITDIFSQYTQNEKALFTLKLIITWFFLLVPALFLGGALPLLTGLFQKTYKSRTNDASLVYFWDTLGAACGSLLVDIGFIPLLGIHQTFWLIISFNCLLFLIFWKLATVKKIIHGGLSFFIITIVVLMSLNFMSFNQKTQTVAPGPLLEKNFFQGQDILWQKNSPFGVVTVTQSNQANPPLVKSLYINYRKMCYALMPKIGSEIDLGHNTTQLMATAGNVLNIGLGCGMTAQALAQSPKVKTLTIAEINPVIVEANDTNFKEANQAILQNPKIDLRVEDGAVVIRQAPKKSFAAIVIDIEEPSIIHSSPLFTKEYYQIAQAKLKDDGVLAVWFFENPHKDTLHAQKIIFNTLKSVFPYVKAYHNPGYNGFSFYASNTPLQATKDQPDLFNFATHVQTHPSKEINTLDNRILEKYFDIANYFEIPPEITPDHY